MQLFLTVVSKNMKKILVVINSLGVGGAERLVVDDINEMIQRGLDVHLLTLKKEKQTSLAHECNISNDKWFTVDVKTIWNVFGWFDVYKYLKRLNPDKVFSHLWLSNTMASPLSRLVGVKDIVIFEHNIYDSVKNARMYFVDKVLQGLPKKIVAVSSAVKDSLIGHGIHKDRIVVVNNGIKLSKYKTEKDSNYRVTLGVPRDAFVFTTVGRLIDQKGIDVLIRAFAKSPVNSHLVIVGQGPKESLLKEMGESLGVSKRIHFLGPRKDIPEILASSDCFVLASRWEGLGIVVLEAMASKLPIILSDFKAGTDMIQNGLSGIVVEKENDVALSVEMKNLMEDRSLQLSLSQSAYEKVQEFTIEGHVNKIMSL